MTIDNNPKEVLMYRLFLAWPWNADPDLPGVFWPVVGLISLRPYDWERDDR